MYCVYCVYVMCLCIVCLYVCIVLCVCMYVLSCVYVCMYVCMYVCVYYIVCMCMHVVNKSVNLGHHVLLMDDEEFSSACYQRVYQYISCHYAGHNLDNFSFKETVTGTPQNCLQHILQYVCCYITLLCDNREKKLH